MNTAPLQRELALIYRSMIAFKDRVRLQGKYIEKIFLKMKTEEISRQWWGLCRGGVEASLIKHPVTVGGSTLAEMSRQG